MPNELDQKMDPGESAVYEIRVGDALDERWTDWFGGLDIKPTDDGDTLLSGLVADQAALHGLLRKVRDLGLPLISVTLARTEQIDEPAFKQPIEASTLEGKQDGSN